LKEIAQKTGVVQLRAAGVAPGPITEREWPKFERAVGNLDLSQSEESLVKQLGDVYKYLNNVASSNAAPQQPVARSSGGAMKQMDGVTYVQRGSEWFAL
jgi:hypothetical protein